MDEIKQEVATDVASEEVVADETAAQASENTGKKKIIMYEPSPTAVFAKIVPDYISGIVYGALCESLASELSARRTAMEAATDNAGEIIEELSLKYNRARQAAITQEITEIVAGSQV